MNHFYVGIIRKTKGVADGPDQECFASLRTDFPGAFSEALVRVAGPLSLLGNFEEATRGDSRLFFRGALFNRLELDALAGEDCDNAADLVLCLFEKFGTGVVSRINGQFTIICLNQARREIAILNDHLGVEQVLYHESAERIVFGSCVKYLQRHADVPKGVDWDAALRRQLPHVVLGGYKSYKTWFKDVELLPEATELSVNTLTGESSQRTYWSVPEIVPDASDSRSAQEVMNEYIALLEDAVRIRMNQAGTTHALLSGGLDSSVVCGLARTSGPINTYSIINQTTVLEDTTLFCDRMARGQEFANEQYLVPYHELCYDVKLWKQQVWRAESPVNHTDSLTKTLLHYAIAKAHPDVETMLTGTGSDQMNGGLIAYVAAVSDSKDETWDNFRDALRDVENVKLIPRDQDALWAMRKLVNRDFLSEMSGVSFEKNYWNVCMDGALHAQAYSLLWDEQRASMSHGHMTYYPFMDYRLAEFIAAIPGRLHKELFYDKQILREPARQFVPGYIVDKPKMPYNLPEYDTRTTLFEMLTADGPQSLFTEAFGEPDTPHPVIDKRQLYNKIAELRQKPAIMDWLTVIHIINLGLLEQMAAKTEAELDFESEVGPPEQIDFSEPEEAKSMLERRLSIMSTDELLEKPVRFGENCSYLFDTKSKKYYLSKRNNLLYEIDDEYADWKKFLEKIDDTLTARQILNETGVAFATIEEFYRLSLREQILVTNDKSRGY